MKRRVAEAKFVHAGKFKGGLSNPGLDEGIPFGFWRRGARRKIFSFIKFFWVSPQTAGGTPHSIRGAAHFIWATPHLVWGATHSVWGAAHAAWGAPRFIWGTPHGVWGAPQTAQGGAFPPRNAVITGFSLKIARNDAFANQPDGARRRLGLRRETKCHAAFVYAASANPSKIFRLPESGAAAALCRCSPNPRGSFTPDSKTKSQNLLNRFNWINKKPLPVSRKGSKVLNQIRTCK
jgi:hypothetical protein